MAEHLFGIVRAGTAGDAGVPWVSALVCRRRPGRRPCPGHLAVIRSNVEATIEWRCTACGDDGVIRGWERSPYDLRTTRIAPAPTGIVRLAISSDVAATLRSLRLLDTDCERAVFRANASEQGIVLAADEDDLEELVGFIAAEANHEEDRRRQKRLDAAFEVMNEALKEADRL